MKFVGLNNKEYNKDISKYRRKKISKSIGQQELGEKLENIFSQYMVLEEFPCFGSNLYLDFFIPQLKIAFEYQGEQHRKYNSFFHKSLTGFADSKKRDAIKQQWCEINQIQLIEIYSENITNLRAIINERINK